MKDKNTPRRARALKALRTADYMNNRRDGMGLFPEHIIDILTDLRHLVAKRNDIDFDNCVRISKNHFEVEQ